jgi:hypothetical protein
LLTNIVVKQATQILCPQLVFTDATLSSKSTRQTGHSEMSSEHLGVVLVGETNRMTCSEWRAGCLGAGGGTGVGTERGTGVETGRGTGVGTGGETGAVTGQGADGRGRAAIRARQQREQLQFLWWSSGQVAMLPWL